MNVRDWWNMFISWLPLIILIIFWAFFVKKFNMSRQPELIERTFQHYDRIEALLERIAVASERQPGH
jgi:flagellar biogenesis protein FliO